MARQNRQLNRRLGEWTHRNFTMDRHNMSWYDPVKGLRGMDSRTFGSVLRRHRRSAEMTQEDLAERAGLSVRAIGDLERDVGRIPRRDTIQLLLDALQVEPAERAEFERLAREGAGAAAPPALPSGAFLGALPTNTLVGRKRQLQRLLDAVDAVAAGSGRLVLLVGEPGVGKTRLAQEVAVRARDRGYLMATGRCYEPEQTVAFYPFIEALSAAYAVAPASVREEVPRRWPYLAQLLPDLGLEPTTPARSDPEGQHQLLRAVAAFLRAIATTMPVALLLDDLHWADTASLKLLLHLARYTRGDRILVLGTYRDVNVDATHPLERAIVDLNRERLVERVVVYRLDEPETFALIESTLGVIGEAGELAAMVYRSTDGNPFFVQEVVRGLIERGDIYRLEGRWTRREIRDIRVPETIQAAVAARLSRLSAIAQEILDEASVLGQTFSFDDIWAIDGRSEDEVDAGLQEATTAGLLYAVGGESYGFSHALTQQALYSRLSVRRRRRLHLAAGRALERLAREARVQRAEDLTRHLREGGEPERALPYAMMAGERAERSFAYAEAERYYRSVLEFIAARHGSLDESSIQAETRTLEAIALARVGRILNITERYREALDSLERAAMLFALSGDVAAEGQILAEIGWVHRSLGTEREGIARIEAAVEALAHAADALDVRFARAGLYTALARLLFGLGRYREELTAAECASTLSREIGDRMVLAVAETRRGVALITVGRQADAFEVLERAAALAQETHSLGTMSIAYEGLGSICRDEGRFVQSRLYFGRAFELAEQTAVPGRVAWALTKLGRITFLLGRWREARGYFERAVEIARTDDLPSPIPYFTMHLGHLALLQGDPDGAHLVEPAIRAAQARNDVWMVRYGEWILASRDVREGRPDEARSRLESLLDRSDVEEPQVTVLLPTLAAAYLRLGERARAEGTVAACERRMASFTNRPASVDVLRVRGSLLAEEGRWEAAAALLVDAASLAGGMPYPYAQAQALHDLGMVLSGAGRNDEARGALTDAVEMFAGLHAAPDRDRSQRALAALH